MTPLNYAHMHDTQMSHKTKFKTNNALVINKKAMNLWQLLKTQFLQGFTIRKLHL